MKRGPGPSTHSGLGDYGALAPGGKRAKSRVREGRSALESIAGSQEGAARLVNDIAGFDNRTTAEIRLAFDRLKKDETAYGREAKSVLLWPLRGLSLQQIRALGFGVGPDFWRNVKERDIRRPLADGRTGASGRAMHPKAAGIEEGWRKVSFPASGGGRVFYGTKNRAARMIRESVGGAVSLNTVTNHLPPGIKCAARPTDLCPICEELKSLRLGPGAPVESTCAMGRDAGALVPRSAKAAAVKVLERHEELAARLQRQCAEDMRNPPEDAIVAICDWSGNVVLRGHRSDAYEFFNASSIQLIGARVSFRGADGCPRQMYIHGYGKVNAPFAKTGDWCATAIGTLLAEAISVCGTPPKRHIIWLDTAQHFRNKCLLYEVPNALHRAGAASVQIRFHAEHHGKTPVDASFRRAKEWIRLYLDFAAVKALFVTVEQAIMDAYDAAAPAGEYRVLFLPGTGPAATSRQLRILEVRKLQALESSLPGGYTITYANGTSRRRATIPTDEVNRPGAGKDHVLATKQQKASYVSMVLKKFAP